MLDQALFYSVKRMCVFVVIGKTLCGRKDENETVYKNKVLESVFESWACLMI